MRGNLEKAPQVRLSDLFDLDTMWPTSATNDTPLGRYVSVFDLPMEVKQSIGLVGATGFHARPLRNVEFDESFSFVKIPGVDPSTKVALVSQEMNYPGEDLVGIVETNDLTQAVRAMVHRLHQAIAREAIRLALRDVTVGIEPRYTQDSHASLRRQMSSIARKDARLATIADFPDETVSSALGDLLEQQEREHPILLGMAVRSMKGEVEMLGEMERFTGAGAWGVISDYDDANLGISFASGTKVYVSKDDLCDPRRYQLQYGLPPAHNWDVLSHDRYRSNGVTRTRLRNGNAVGPQYDMEVVARPATDADSSREQRVDGKQLMDVDFQLRVVVHPPLDSLLLAQGRAQICLEQKHGLTLVSQDELVALAYAAWRQQGQWRDAQLQTENAGRMDAPTG